MFANPYLTFDGNCAEAFAFYQQHLGGKITIQMTYGDAPDASHVSEADRGRIMHTCLVSGRVILMGSDSHPGHHAKLQGFSISLSFYDIAETERVWAALSEGGAVSMALQETFWTPRFGMVVDRFGTPWMVTYEKPADPPK